MPEPDILLPLVIGGVIAFAVIRLVVQLVRGRKGAATAGRGDNGGLQKRQEALFVTSFPELQPYLHPENVLQFVKAWAGRTPRSETLVWNSPPGFGPSRVRLSPMGEKGQMAELLGEADKVLASFQVQQHPEGGVIRLGPGKLTANLRDSAVRYWHPEREFKWSKAKGWRVINALSDRGIDSSDRGMSLSNDGSSSTATSAAAAVAGAAVVAGAGGAFDGGGSSSSWDAGSESRTSY